MQSTFHVRFIRNHRHEYSHLLNGIAGFLRKSYLQGFRPNCLIPTRVLSIFQEIQNNLAGNLPTLSIYVDYHKAYDKVWNAALIVKLSRLRDP